MTQQTLTRLRNRLTEHEGGVRLSLPGYSQLAFRVVVVDVRQVYGRVDVLVTPTQGAGQQWVSIENISGIQFDDILN